MERQLDNADTVLNGLNGVSVSMEQVCDILLEVVKEQPENARLVAALKKLSTERVNLTSCIAFAAENIPSKNLDANVETARKIHAEVAEKDRQVYAELNQVVPQTSSEKMFK